MGGNQVKVGHSTEICQRNKGHCMLHQTAWHPENAGQNPLGSMVKPWGPAVSLPGRYSGFITLLVWASYFQSCGFLMLIGRKYSKYFTGFLRALGEFLSVTYLELQLPNHNL